MLLVTLNLKFPFYSDTSTWTDKRILIFPIQVLKSSIASLEIANISWIFDKQRRKNINNLRVLFFKHKYLKYELRYAKFIKFNFKLKLSAGIFKNFWFIHEITWSVL